MKLDEIVETTFLPPRSVGQFSGSDINFGCEEKLNHFYPLLCKPKHDVTHYINDMADGVDDFAKTHHPSCKEAIQHCWKYFNNNPHIEPKERRQDGTK